MNDDSGLPASGAVASESGPWVAVDDAMPARFDEVLGCYATPNGPRVVRALLAWDGKRWTYDAGVGFYSGDVTHWMSLPPPPPSVVADASAESSEDRSKT